MADTREDRIRHRAHMLWDAAGRPDGDHDAHWHQAEREIDADAAPPTPDVAPAAPEPVAAGPVGSEAVAPEPATETSKPAPAKVIVRKPRATPKPRTSKKA